MRVVFNQTSALGAKTGIGHYTHQLMQALRAEGIDVDGAPSGLLAFGYRRLAASGSLGKGTGSARHSFWSPALAAGKAWLRRAQRQSYSWLLTRAIGKLAARCELYHEPNYLAVPSTLPTVLTIHDLSVLRLPQFHPIERVREYERLLPLSLRQAAHVVTVSETIRQEIISMLGYPASRVTTTPNGIHPGLRPLEPAELLEARARLGLPECYLLYLGTLEPRKNILMLMQAYCSLPSALRERCPLLLVGNWGWNFHDIERYFRTHGRHANVRHLGYVHDEDLLVLYNGARALVSPSLYEGFGLPPLEMLACGGAVIASRIGAAEEVLGAQGVLLDPHDHDAWQHALRQAIVDEDWCNQLRRGATEAAARFSWQRCAQTTLAVYRKILGASAPPLRKAS